MYKDHSLFPFLYGFFLWHVSDCVHSARLQSHGMSLGSTVLPHKHKSLSACGDFIPEEMRCHLLCKGKITIVENMTAPSAHLACLAEHWTAVVSWIHSTFIADLPSQAFNYFWCCIEFSSLSGTVDRSVHTWHQLSHTLENPLMCTKSSSYRRPGYHL